MEEKYTYGLRDIGRQFKEGLLTNNPTLVQLLGMCPTLAVSTSVENGIGMGLSVVAVLIMSNFVISLIRKFIPANIRIASYIVIIAGFVTVIDMLLKAYVPALSESLGLFIPLITVNCIILGRAESFASKNKVVPSVIDGLTMGLGFTLAITILSAIREVLGSGTFLGMPILAGIYPPALLIALPAGGFLCLGVLIALVQWIRAKAEARASRKAQREVA